MGNGLAVSEGALVTVGGSVEGVADACVGVDEETGSVAGAKAVFVDGRVATGVEGSGVAVSVQATDERINTRGMINVCLTKNKAPHKG